MPEVHRPDPRLAEAALIPIMDAAARLGVQGLRRAGVEHVGPCPSCGGRDRFAIHPRKGVFNCRGCGASGDQIALTQLVLRCDFKGALAFLVGDEIAHPDPARQARLKEEAEAKQRRQADYEAKARRYAISEARRIWRAAAPGHGTMAEAYLARRGIRFPGGWPPSLRFLADHPAVKRIGGRDRELHRGPCMIAAIQGADRRLMAVHQTWLDPSGPKGKAVITPPGSKPFSKLVRGSKKGGAIRLTAWAPSGLLVMGEGIETTASILTAGHFPAAAFWAGVDLGNMSGRQEGRNSGVPDMSDERAFVPPPQTQALVYLQDGDSAPGPTRAKLLSGIRRARACVPGLRGWIVSADPGADFNDMLQEQQEQKT